MAQTFDIRFARSAGLAGLFERPTNDFRWKGAGRLSIDASGISIAVKRGLLTLFTSAPSRRFSPSSLVEVYREGNALRLEFSTQESPRTVLPVWVSDREAAAKIVNLLPTQRSVELEDGASAPRKYRFDRRLISFILAAAVLLGSFALMLPRYLAENLAASPVESAAQPFTPPASHDPQVASPTSAVLAEVGSPTPASRAASASPRGEYQGSQYPDPGQASASSVNAPAEYMYGSADEAARTARESSAGRAGNSYRDGIDPTIPAGMATAAIASPEFDRFRAESNSLRSDYLYLRDHLTAEGLEALEARWMKVTSRIYNTPYLGGMSYFAMREMELAISRSWRDYLSVHAAGLRRNDHRLIELSASLLAFAEELEAQMRQFAP